MKLINKKIGEFVEQYSEKCNIPNLTIYDVSGVNREKEFFEPSQQVGKDTSNYKVVPPGYFACNLMHVGRDIVLPISMNTNDSNKIVSPAYFVFYINHEEIILKEFFFIYLNSIEKNRFFWFHTDSSIRDGLSWEDFCDLEISIPPIEVQQKYVDIYNSLLENQQVFEKGTEDLKLVCDAYIENVRKKNGKQKIDDLIQEVAEKNTEGQYKNEKGVSIEKKFIDTKSSSSDIKSQKVVYPKQFAFNSNTSRNSDTLSIAYNSDEPYIISNTYVTFKCSEDNLLPEYLFMWFKRKEFDRFARYNSWGSARETISLAEIKDYEISIPSIEMQQAIVNVQINYLKRVELNKKLKEQIKNICPVLIAGAIKEGEKANG